MKDILTPEKTELFFILRTLAVVVLFAFFHTGLAFAEKSEQIEFIYVNANVGAAAGGHTAIKLGEDVFHYQFFPDKRFLLVRESWEHFKLIYTRLRNRSLYTAVCRVERSSYQKIKDNFNHALGVQSFDLYQEDILEEQLYLLQSLRNSSLRVRVAGLGFFDQNKEGFRALCIPLSATDLVIILLPINGRGAEKG